MPTTHPVTVNEPRYTGGVIVIPTRNRADLAVNAIRSVLDQPGCEIEVIVSDNSTSAKDLKTLEGFCRELKDERLRYIRPEVPLQMCPHWEWALAQAWNSRFDHFTFLTDRMVFKPGSLKAVSDLVRRYPDKLLVYMHDKVVDHAPPFTVIQLEWTGKLLRVESRRLLELSAQSVIYDASCPRMLNCFVPRTVLRNIRQRFGNFFSSFAPDWNFAYRSLATVDSLHYFHYAALAHYAQARSNGAGLARGTRNDTSLSFLREFPKPLNSDAPFPEIMTVWNTIISEYCAAGKETASPKFPELDMEKYIKALAFEIEAIEAPEQRQEMYARLMERGWQPEIVPPVAEVSMARKLISPHRIATKLKWIFARPRPLELATPRQALDYATQHSRPKSASVPWEEELLEAVEIPGV